MEKLIENLRKKYDFIELNTFPVSFLSGRIHFKRYACLIKGSYPKVIIISEVLNPKSSNGIEDFFEVSVGNVSNDFPNNIFHGSIVTLFSIGEEDAKWLCNFIEQLEEQDQ